MRYLVAFICGAIVGAFVLFLFLQETGRAVASPRVETRGRGVTGREAPSRAGTTTRTDSSYDAIDPPEVPEVVPQSTSAVAAINRQAIYPQGPGYDVVVIPVAGIERSDLRDTFAEARGKRRHNAIDILAPHGTPVLATVDGVVAKIFESKQGGLTVYVSDPRKEWIHYFAHLARYAPGLREGMQIRQGELIGYVGVTGNAPPGTPHLHFSIDRLPPSGEWWKGIPTNPYPVFMQRGVTYEAPVARGGR